MKRLTIIFVLIVLAGFACTETPPPCLTCPPGPERISIDTVLVDPTEVWLKVSIPAYEPFSTTLRVTRDDQTIFSKTTNPPFDTTIQDRNLLPNRSYRYKVLTQGVVNAATGATLNVTTMDTTSHNLTWQVDTLGTESSVLRDVAIISDTSVWVVGELYEPDSTGQPTKYNAAHWDGQQWNLLVVLFPVCDFNGIEVGTAPFACKAVFGFGENDVWFTSGGDFVHWDGSSFERICLQSGIIAGEILKLWGTSSQNLFGVGRNGTTIYFNGTVWQKQASGTTVDLTDVWGTPDGSQVWACGERTSDGSSVLVASNGTGSWRVLWDAFDPNPRFPYRYALQSLWTPGRSKLIVTGSTTYYHSLIDTNLVQVTPFQPPYYGYCIRGTAINNACLVGPFAMVVHYNGSTWHVYEDLLGVNDRLFGLAVTDRLIVAVGTRFLPELSNTGLIVIGRK